MIPSLQPLFFPVEGGVVYHCTLMFYKLYISRLGDLTSAVLDLSEGVGGT